MSDIISIKKLCKYYGKTQVLNDINVTVQTGEIIGVVGTNGAGKTTLLKSLLGLLRASGTISVCGLNPYRQQTELMKNVSFIADTAILPKWITIHQLLAYMDGIHPNFSIDSAKQFLANTNIKSDSKVSKLSKGMVTQLHLALVIAIKSELLVLDEPTLGLDIIKRKSFYNQLLEHYFDDNNTVIIASHQIEEIEHILTRVLFIEDGKILADFKMTEIEERFCQLTVAEMNNTELLALSPIFQQKTMNGMTYIFSDVPVQVLSEFGNVITPNLSDVFMALATQNIKEYANV